MNSLASVPPYPVNLSIGGIPANLCKNRTPDGRFQILKVLTHEGPQGAEFELLWEGNSEAEAEEFARIEAEKTFPSLLTRDGFAAGLGGV